MRVGRLSALVVAAALGTGVAATLGGGEVAFAHAKLVETNPANQAVLAVAPAEIELRFSEAVDPLEPAIRLLDADGTEIPIGPVGQPGGADTMSAGLPDGLADGTYVVGWQAVSADSHKVRGAFSFSVGSATPTAPGVIDGIFDAESQSAADSLLLGIGRWLSFAGIGVLVGAVVIAPIIAPGVVGDRRTGRLLVVAAVVAAVGTLLMLVAQAHLLSGSYLAVGDVAATRSGRWWFARLAAIVGIALLARFRTRLVNPGGRVLTAVGGLGALAVVAAGGHGVAGESTSLGYPATVVHLAAMSIWLAGVVLIAVAIPRSDTWMAAASFSPWALGSVIVLALSGSVNAWRQLGAFFELTDSAYGRWLVVKLVLVLVVVMVASFSRRTLRLGSPDDDGASLRRTVTLEAAGMAVVLMATAGLVNATPPPPSPVVQSASAIVGERIVQVELDPAATAGGELHVYLTSPGGGLDQADEVTVEASLPSANLGPIEIDVIPAGPNHVVATDVALPVAGRWTFEVTARFGEFDQVVFTVELPVSD